MCESSQQTSGWRIPSRLELRNRSPCGSCDFISDELVSSWIQLVKPVQPITTSSWSCSVTNRFIFPVCVLRVRIIFVFVLIFALAPTREPWNHCAPEQVLVVTRSCWIHPWPHKISQCHLNGPGRQHNRSEVATVAKNADPVGAVLGIHGCMLSKLGGEAVCCSSSQLVPFRGIPSQPKAYYCLDCCLLVSSSILFLFPNDVLLARSLSLSLSPSIPPSLSLSLSLSLSHFLHFVSPYGFGGLTWSFRCWDA